MSIDSSSKAALHKGYKHWCPEVEPREDWDKDFNFVLIRSIEELKKLDVEHKFVAWDTETSGLNPDIDWLVGFSFSFDGKTGYYVPVKHDDIALGKEALDIFHSILKKAGTQFLYNCRFDQRFFEAAGYSLEGLRYYDVMNAIWLADTNVLMPSLKVSERRFLGWIPKTFSETLGDATTFQHVPAEDAYKYACTDALGTYHLALISNQFYKESYPASKYDNDALYPMMRLENTPQRLDLEYLKSLRSSVEARIDESLQQVYQLAGCTFNVNSPAQFGKIMLERFGVDTGVRTSTGAMKADLKTLEGWMVKHGSKASPEVKEFLSAYKEYKKTVKFKSSYLDKYIKAAEESETFPIRFSYKFQSVPCLTENNTVLTKSRGFVSIKDVQSDDMIWTAWGYKRVLWNHSHEVDEFYRVTLKNGMTLEGTGHHPVLVRKSPLEKVAYSGMTKDDVEWAGIQDLKPDEPVVINHTPASLSCQDSWKSSLARIMGYFYGHGRMPDGEMMSLIFDNPDLSYHYAEWMKSLFGDEKVFPYDLGKGKVEYSITRQTLAKFLVEHDVIPAFDENCFWRLDPVSTYTEEAYRISRMPDTFRNFLVGYLDSAKTSVRDLWYIDVPDDWTDGVTKDRVVFVIPSSCKDVIIPMFWASAIGCKVTDHTFKIGFCEDKVTRVEVSDPYSLSNLLNLWNNTDVGLIRFSCVDLPKTFRMYTESMVQSVEHLHAKSTVYDIEVEDVHEYVAGGIVTHNTGRLSCLSRDALVHTLQGLVPIVDITEEHDIEVSPNKFAKAKLVHTGEQDFVKIVMSSGKEIECTTDHRFLCPSEDGFVWRYARDLKVSDMLCRTREYEIYSESIISIDPCGKKEAYTLSVDDPLHRYIAEGFIHHNCGGDKKNSFFTQNNVQCLEEDTSVITSEGIKPIKQVKTGDLVWTGSEFAPCQQLGSRKKICEPIFTYFGSITASLEHKFLTLNLDSFDLEFNVLANVISQGLPVVRNVQDGGFTFKELIENEKFKDSMLFRPELSEEIVECLSEKFRDVRFDMVKSAKYFWYPNIIPPEVTVYDLYVPGYERFVANGFIVHNSTPKPHSLMVKGRKATQEEINQGKDILGWYLSNDIPDDEAIGLVEGMDPDHFNLRRAFLPKDDDCYVVSIDMKAEELRLVANIYNEKTWADAFIHGKDVHKACYSPDTEFLVLDHGWMTADHITKGMKIAYYDPMDDEVKFSKAGERYSHEASEVYTHPTLFNVTDNHRMWISTPDVGFRIVRASELKSQGSQKQKFRMKTAVGQRKSFQSIESHFGRKLGQYFCYGFMYFAPHYYDEEGFVHITLDSPCTKIPHDFALFLHSGDFSSTKFSVDRELSLGLRSLEASNPCTYLFSLAKTEYKDEPIFLQDFVYGMLVYLSSTKFNTLNLGDGSKVSGKVVVSSKEHADAIQWLLMLTGSTCRVDSSKSSVYGEGAYVLTIFSDVSSLPKSLGSTFGSVKQKNIAEKHLTYSCFSVPSGLLVTRYKGQITVNGNTAIKLFGEENYSKEARKQAKIASFGILYGSGAQGFNSSFPEMSLDECRQFLAKFREALPSIEQGQAENVAYAREHGTINTGYGRQRRVRSYFQSGDRAQIAFAERTVKNSVVQGTAADVLKLIFCRLWANVFKPYPDVTFMSTIHDEVNFSMPKRLAREVIPICMECMTIRRDDWPVTLECSLSIGRDSLGDLIPFTYNKETKEFTPEWEESGEVLKKRAGHVETKPSDNDVLDVEECEDPYFGLPPEACEF